MICTSAKMIVEVARCQSGTSITLVGSVEKSKSQLRDYINDQLTDMSHACVLINVVYGTGRRVLTHCREPEGQDRPAACLAALAG